MQALRETFPNAKTVFDYLESEFLLAHQCGQPLSFAPFGLVGSPGVGKSVLVEAICKLLRCSLYRVQVEISSHASALVGTELHWSNAGPGMLFLALAMGQQANPIIMLDELEKCPTRDDYPNMHKVLYSLLEPASARNFRDASFPGVPLDASRVRWIATANSLTSIPAAIQSRMRFFEVPPLTLEQSQKILLGMDAKLRIQLKVGDWPALSTEVVEQLALESPRRMQMLLRAAYGNAMVRSRRVVSLEDLPPKEATPVVPKDGEETNRQLEHLLTMTNLAALRALEVQRRLSMAERLWSFAETSSDTIH